MSVNSNNPNPVKKARAACRNWPNCGYGDKCKFFHDPMLAAMKAEMEKRMAQANAAMVPIRRIQACCEKLGIRHLDFALASEVQKKNLIGDQIYPKVTLALKEGDETMRETGLWHPAITAGKITGMILEAYKPEESLEICCDDKRLGELMVTACERIKAHAEAR